MAKTMLNQTMSRPILYEYAQEQIAKTPNKWAGETKKAIQEFLATLPKIKKIVTDKISTLTPQEDLDVLAKYDMTEQESCFWFTDTDTENVRRDKQSIYANFSCKGYSSYYSYGSSKREVGNLSTDDLIALYYEDMVANNIDVVKYKFVKDNGCDYNGKRMNTYHKEIRDIANKINAYQQKFFDDNDMTMSFTVPRSNSSCHQRARLITSEQLAVFDDYLSKLERVHLKWHKHYEQMKEKFKAYAELIRSSKNLEQVIEVWSEAENVRHKITGTGTALALSSISESIIQQDMAERKLANTVAVVITNTESVGV